MQTIIIAVRDIMVDAFNTPFPSPSVGAAIRGFQDALANPQHEMTKHPEHYELYQLATWDPETGIFTNDKKRIAVGQEHTITKG